MVEVPGLKVLLHVPVDNYRQIQASLLQSMILDGNSRRKIFFQNQGIFAVVANCIVLVGEVVFP